MVSPCGDVEESLSNYNAIGSGSAEAKSILWTLDSVRSPLVSWERLELALEGSAEFTIGIKKPWSFLYAMHTY